MTSKQVENGTIVSITYDLTVDGVVFDQVGEDNPFEYLHGKGNIVPGLEAALNGKKIGDSFEITLKPQDAYGEYDESLIETVSRKDFVTVENAPKLHAGQTIKLVDKEDNVINATILKFNEQVVVLDYNPVLAGKTLTYRVKVLDIYEPTVDEWIAGVPHSLQDSLTFNTDDEEQDI